MLKYAAVNEQYCFIYECDFMNLYDITTVKRILSKHGFTFSKALGQNFLINPDVCPQMAECLNADADTAVIEIGPGIGVLTKELCLRAGKVITIELDKRLLPVLEETVGEFDNLEVINADVMELDLNQIIKDKLSDFKHIKVCANLPYYITSPVIMMLLESRLPIDEIVVMVQKEAGERLCAEVGSRDAGAVTAAVDYYAQSRLIFDVGRESFVPSPRVDSVVIGLKIRKENKYCVTNEKRLFSLIRSAFAQRRKTALNSIANSTGMSKAELAECFNACSIDENTRAENLSMDDFIRLCEYMERGK